jgi:capsular polysaccharide biosynthesis protein
MRRHRSLLVAAAVGRGSGDHALPLSSAVGFDTLSGARTGIEEEARMRQETLGVSRFLQFVLMGIVGEVAMMGLLAGIVFAALHPPMLTSTAAVLLPEPPQSTQAATSNGAPGPYMATQAVIAESNPVLSAALPHARPAMSLAELRGDVQIRSVTNLVITVSAKGRVAADAEATANAVARSYVVYVSAPDSPAGPVGAQVLNWATSATGRPLPASLLITGGFGALCGAIVGAIGALAFGWADRRFRIGR